ncbi:MAG: SEC-C domain-containing protein [Defluviimonas sp.]|nr:SEC-C domain-containing protein [Defluviimonas sp.]
MQITQETGGAPASRRYRQQLVTDAIDELSRWHCYSDAFFEEQKARKVPNAFRVAPWTEALQAPAGKVGRNDPCPCGSGRKFKKCCLQ